MAYSVLIVEDNIAIKESIEDFLEMKNYRVDSAASAEAAIEKMKAFRSDIVLTDIMMRGMDGLELTRLVTSQFDACVIVMTGYSEDYSYAEAINAGANDFIFKPFRFEELELRLKRVIRELELKKQHDRMLREMEKLAITDDLTDLYNSRHFFDTLEAEIERHQRYSRPLSLLILDIDYFKHYNDDFGHLEGDRVLEKLGDVISSCLRNTDTAYRYGGDEFTAILPETELEQACLVGERIKESIARQRFMPENGRELSVTLSIGVTELKPDDTLESFVKRGDRALYLSKDAGRNKLTCVTDLNPE